MTELSYLAAGDLSSVGTLTLWAVTIAGVIALLVLDFLATHKPHEVLLKEAFAWSAFYIALPLAFGGWVWSRYGSELGVQYLTGYLVEKSLSVDNLFVFMLLLAAFAVPAVLAQRVLLYGIAGALLLRAVFIALGAAALQTLDFAFLLFAVILAATAVKLLRNALSGREQEVDINRMRSVKLLRRLLPVVDDYHGTRLTVRDGGRRATNAFALLGLRALYFVLHAALSRLVHLSYGLAAILAFISLKLGLHWAHGVWSGVPQIPTLASLGVIIGVLVIVTLTSLRATRHRDPGDARAATRRP